MRGRRVIAALAAAAVALLPNFFYLTLFGTPSLLAAKAAHWSNLSAARTSELFFDLNLGMLPYLPMTVPLFLILLIREVAKGPRGPALRSAFLLLAMAVLCTPTDHWNHGTTGPSRYVIWMLPLLFLALVEAYSRARSRPLLLAVAGALSVQAVVTLAHGGFTSRLDHNRHSYLARFILDRAPTLYRPSPAIFVERTLHIALEDEQRLPTPVVYRRGGRCRKALVRKEELADLEGTCSSPASKLYRARAGEELFYVDF